MAKIPAFLHDAIAKAFPANVVLIGSVQGGDGFAQITPRGSVLVYDGDSFSMWERGKGSTTASLKDGASLTVFFRDPSLRERIPGGIARFYGKATIHRSGPIYEAVWERLIAPEKSRDPDKKGFAVIITCDRAEMLSGDPLPDV